MLIHRVQLPEDNALSQTTAQTTQAPNPPTTTTSTTDDRTASQDSETTAAETQPPTVGETTGTSGTAGSAAVRLLNDYMGSDPHMKICQFQSPSSTDSELGINRHVRVHSILLSDCHQSTRGVALSTPYSSGGCVLDVLVSPGCTFCPERTNCGFDH